MKTVLSGRLGLALLVATVIIAAVLVVANYRGDGGTGAGNYEAARTATGRAHGLDDSPQARFLSIFVYDARGGVSSFMVGGGTEEFGRFAEAIRDAQPVGETEDETFSDLLVLSFGSNDTMEMSYSRSRNLLAFNGQVYRPPLDLAAIIGSVEQRLSN